MAHWRVFLLACTLLAVFPSTRAICDSLALLDCIAKIDTSVLHNTHDLNAVCRSRDEIYQLLEDCLLSSDCEDNSAVSNIEDQIAAVDRLCISAGASGAGGGTTNNTGVDFKEECLPTIAKAGECLETFFISMGVGTDDPGKQYSELEAKLETHAEYEKACEIIQRGNFEAARICAESVEQEDPGCFFVKPEGAGSGRQQGSQGSYDEQSKFPSAVGMVRRLQSACSADCLDLPTRFEVMGGCFPRDDSVLQEAINKIAQSVSTVNFDAECGKLQEAKNCILKEVRVCEFLRYKAEMSVRHDQRVNNVFGRCNIPLDFYSSGAEKRAMIFWGWSLLFAALVTLLI